jgi:thioredoxin-dependent peroxiredoxin
MNITVKLATLPLLLLAAVPAHAALAVGAIAPDFTTQAALGGKPFQISLGKALKKGPVVLYFYPKAFTQGCTLEANQFADATAQFNKMGATVIGVSADDIKTLKEFSVKECRNKFAVAVGSPAMITAYDVKLSDAMSNRTSYVVDRRGRIAYAYSSLDYRAHVANTLAAVKALSAKPK